MKKIASGPQWFALLSILIILFVFNGCSVWENFTTYFNLYYNASDKFEEAETLINAQPKDLFQMEELKAPGNTSQTLTQVIEKLSKLLQFYSKSSYVDNSLLMIGKAFYYQQDYIKASRKFNELITTFPESDLVLEGMLWYGKSQLRENKFDEALKMLDQVKERAVKEDENDILTLALVQQISYYIYKEQYPEAVTGLNSLAEQSEDGEIVAQGVYELGMIYLELNDPTNAAKAFANVKNYTPDFDTEFKANLELGKVERQLGDNDRALSIFEDMKGNSSYNEYLDQVDLEIGLTQYELKKYDDAFEQLTIVDSTYKQTSSSGIARFTLGLIMEKAYHNFDSANVYYQQALASTAPPEYIESARKKDQVIKKYKTLTSAISSLRKQMIYLTNPDEYLKDSLAYVQDKAIEDSLAKMKQTNVQDQEINQGLVDEQGVNNRNRRGSQNRQGVQPSQTQLVQNTASESKLEAPVRPTVTADSIHTSLAKNEYDLAGLFFTELEVPDSALNYYNNILQEHPNTSYQARTLFALGTYYLTAGDKNKADSLFGVVYDNYKNESIANAAASQLNKPLINFKYDPAEELYIDAENKLKAENYDQAISGFYYISNNYPKSLFASKALYASGWILENKLKLLDSAAVVYDSVLSRYSHTQYATAVIPKVSMYKSEQKRKQAVLDSISNSNKKVVVDSAAIMNKPDTTKQNNALPNVEQEEFTPNVPPPSADSAGQNSGVIDTSMQMKKPGEPVDSIKKKGNQNIRVQEDSLKKTLPPNINTPDSLIRGRKPGNNITTPIDTTKNRNIPVQGDSLKKTLPPNINTPDSLIRGTQPANNIATPPDTTKNKNIRPR